MNKKIIKERVSSSVPSIPSDQPADPTNPVTKMLFECKLSQNQGDASADVDAMVTTAHVKLDAKNQQVRQVAKGEEDQNVIVLSQLEGYLQKGSRSIAGLFLPTSGGVMVGDINVGTSPGNTIKGLPSSWGSAMFLGNEYAASVGIVQDVVGEYGARLDDLIDRITKYAGSGEGSLEQLIKDLGSPQESQAGQTPSVTLKNPAEAKWLLLSAKNAMTGTLRFEKKQGALPITPDPTITNLKAGGLGTIGTATPTDKLQNIVSVADLTTILKDLQENAPSEGTGSDTGSEVGSGSGSGTDSGSGGVAGVSVSAATTSTFPEWTGQEVPYLVYQSQDSGSGSPSVQNPLKSSNADNYIKKDNGTYSLLRRGLYLITFAYEFSSPTQNRAVTCTGTLTKKSDSTYAGGDVAAQPTSGDAADPNPAEPSPVFSVVGSSDGKTIVGSAYILVPGDKALSEHTLTLALTPGENTGVSPTSATASKSYVAISYMGAGY
ncbi:hypothetical protein [Chlamydia trachomatis]|uniref:Uncharacterized protein n=1 Tax=Chlamydia trachomatis TaxID=813 RepID=A1BLN2_CHLTH|nr:hypothetical protein [Chlamydia trachomatis]AAZ20329.1 hypothetical protein CT049 [Chlamydia trachomatis]AAZ39901.1 hypothetical protein CT049 [Chlamydia trachomatis]ABY76955.1 hypothetical protein [Chlamydia trachomatis]ABY76957.1 hypothetical protein [Chlamydia trachomatis]ABY76959.1 hypothetical protein [Chlamydia trachomatis]